jgi:hypothetical protein
MSALSHQALAALPPDLAALATAHARQYPGDANDIVAEIWIAAATAAADDTPEAVYRRARAATRRAVQAQLRAVPLDYVRPADPRYNPHDDHARGVVRWQEPDTTPDPSPLRYADYVREYAARRGCSIRRAQQVIRDTLRRWQGEQGLGQGDLFGGAV